MRQLLDLLALAIEHANAVEPQPEKRRAVVLFFLRVIVTERKKSHDYQAAFIAMTLIRLVNASENVSPVRKALRAAAEAEDGGIVTTIIEAGAELFLAADEAQQPVPPTPNRGVRSSSMQSNATNTIGGSDSVSSADEARDRFSFGALSDFIASNRR